MKTYTSTNPRFSEKINVVETTDTDHASNLNAASKQLLQNDLVLKNRIDSLFGDADNPDTSAPSFAEGIEADNVIDAINEVFQSGNEKKGKLVENLVAMGIEASTDETWESLLNKVLDMTDTSGDTVTAEALLSGYTAHNAAGEQITGAMPDRRSTTVTAAAVTQDDEYIYLDLPEGEACYSGGSKVRALNSDLFNKIETIFLGACSAGQEMTVKTTKSYRLAIMAVWGYSSNTYTKAENQIEICKNKIFSGMSISAGYVVNCPANANLILYRRGIIDGQVADGVGLIIGIC